MRTLKMTIAYRGTRYHGFQRQPNAVTVQGELEKQLARALNGYLPEDISVLACEDAPPEFHARFDCKGKEYLYRIHCHESKNPFLTDLAFHYRRPLDIEKIRYAAAQVTGTHDFHSFCAQGTAVEASGSDVAIRIRGDGFLYNMVRIFVGTLLDINEGVFPPDAMPEILAAKDRLAAGRTAMAHGLYLNQVFYSDAECRNI